MLILCFMSIFAKIDPCLGNILLFCSTVMNKYPV